MLKKIRVSLIVLFTSILLLQSQAYADSLDDGQLVSEETFIILKDDKNVEEYTKKLKENDNGQIEKLAKSITTNTEKNNNTHKLISKLPLVFTNFLTIHLDKYWAKRGWQLGRL